MTTLPKDAARCKQGKKGGESAHGDCLGESVIAPKVPHPQQTGLSAASQVPEINQAVG